MIPIEKIPEVLSDEEKEAIAVLTGKGFTAFTQVKVRDVRELETGLRQRTFRNRGRYDLVIAIRDLGPRLPEPEPEPKPESEPNAVPTGLPPVEEMKLADLRDEANQYPELTGVSKLNKAELAEAVRAERIRRREILHRRFD